MNSDIKGPEFPPRHEVPWVLTDRSASREKHEAAWHVRNQLEQLVRFSTAFHTAVSVFDFGRGNMQAARMRDGSGARVDHALSWMRLAARDGALTIFHYQKSLDGLKASVADCRDFLAVDHTALRAQSRTFRVRFPDFDTVRHAVAHSGEVLKTPKTRDQHVFRGPLDHSAFFISAGSSFMMTETLNGRRFSNTYDGKLASYEVSWDNWRALNEITCETLELFRETS